MAGSSASTSDVPLLTDTVDGAVDYKGRRVSRSNTGGWRSAGFIIGVEIAERFAYHGIVSNLINYLTGSLRQSTATAAENVNTWAGAATMFPLLGAFIADAYLGRYRTILLSSFLYVLIAANLNESIANPPDVATKDLENSNEMISLQGLGLLTLSAVLPSLSPPECHKTNDITACPRPTQFQIIFFFTALYLVALAHGGHKPCVQAFGADQFDGRHPEERKSKSSFFNWWYFGLCGGAVFTLLILTYIQDNMNWGLGFGIPCVSMVVALVLFLLGTKTFRYGVNEGKDSPFMIISRVFVAAARKCRSTLSTTAVEEEAREILPLNGGNQLKFLDKAWNVVSDGTDDSKKEWIECSISQVEEAKVLLRLVPIWATCLVYAMVVAQCTTFFTKQGTTVDRSIGSGFQIPAASLQIFISLSTVLFIPIYDRVLVPVARAFTRKPSGITMLQRIGIGMFLSVITMVIAALVEKKRLKTALDFGLVDIPQATVPMSLWWLVPQYVLLGVADVFTMVGLQEFFYEQVPDGLRSVGLSLYCSIFGVGNFLSSFLVSTIEKATRGGGRDSWFSNNLNRAHVDYFYWLLASLSAVELALYLYFAKSYVYNRGRTM